MESGSALVEEVLETCLRLQWNRYVCTITLAMTQAQDKAGLRAVMA